MNIHPPAQTGKQYPFNRVCTALQSAGCYPASEAPGSWRGACPVCAKRRTLVVNDHADYASVHCFACHAGTSGVPELASAVTAIILSAIGLTTADLGSSPNRVKPNHRAWLASWLANTARLDWPNRQRASVLRMLEAFASLSEQSSTPVVFATLPTLAKRSGRCRKTAWSMLEIIQSAGVVRQLSHTHKAIVDAADGTPRYELRAARWLLMPPVKCAPVHPTQQSVGGGQHGHTLGCKDAHFTPAQTRYPDTVPPALIRALQPGRELDKLLGDTLLETLRAWVVQGGSDLGADDISKLTGRHRVTTVRHLKRLEQTPTPAGRVVTRVPIDGPARGRGHTARYRLSIPALVVLIETL